MAERKTLTERKPAWDFAALVGREMRKVPRSRWRSALRAERNTSTPESRLVDAIREFIHSERSHD